jgi:hypothetical protein
MACAETTSLASATAAVTLMSAIHTNAPARASSRTVASPMPLAPPVTSACRPSRRNAPSVFAVDSVLLLADSVISDHSI